LIMAITYAPRAGKSLKNAFDFRICTCVYKTFVCEGKGPFRWVALSGDPADIAVTMSDSNMFHTMKACNAGELQRAYRLPGLPARICCLAGRKREGRLAFNELVRTGKVKAPI